MLENAGLLFAGSSKMTGPPRSSSPVMLSSWSSRILFLDDSPDRAVAFLAAHPNAMWVQTVEQCIGLLQQPWDEVHLDHDLSGEVLVDHERDDCGMAVVRWLSEQPCPHLRDTRFVIHTHNPNAACMMVLHLQVMGFQVQARPFGVMTPAGRRANLKSLAVRLLRWLGGNRGSIG